MNIFCIAALAMTLLGCATTPTPAPYGLPDGVWSGTLKSVSTAADQEKNNHTADILFASCKGAVRVWASNAAGDYHKLGDKYAVHSYPDSHLIYYMDAGPEQPNWVEIQAYVFLELDSDMALIRWTRAVNNRAHNKSAKGRYYFTEGSTELRRVSRDCDGRLVP